MEDREKLIYLIGKMIPQIGGRKLPTNRQVLQVFFHHHSKEKLTIRKSSSETMAEVMTYWNRAGIPVSQLKQCIVKVEKLFSKWQILQKTHWRKNSPTQKRKESDFKDTLDQIFDIAQRDVIHKLTEDQRLLLRSQGDSARRGFIPLSPSNSAIRKNLSTEFSNGDSMGCDTNSDGSSATNSSGPSTQPSEQIAECETSEGVDDQQPQSKYYHYFTEKIYC